MTFITIMDNVGEKRFIQGANVCHYKNEKLVLATCHFSIQQYTTDLFDHYDVHQPNSIKMAVIKRQAEYLAGRIMAQKALSGVLNNSTVLPQISSGKDRCPNWPIDVCGSITHSSAKAACLVAKNIDWQSVGVDIEDILSPQSAAELQKHIHTHKEGILLTKKGFSDNIATTIIFSAKESLFKALYPRIEKFFGFECAEVVDVDLEKQQLLMKISKNISVAANSSSELVCRYDLQSKTVMTLLYL